MNRRLVVFCLLYVALLLGSWLLSGHIAEFVGFDPNKGNNNAHPMMLSISAIYIITAALPFVPGAEIGFALLATFGADAALLVYFSMLVALSISFLAGRFVPTAWLVGFFWYFGLARSAGLVREMAAMPLEGREKFVMDRLSNKYVIALMRYRYIAFALALNLPGNSLVGGGGGLALLAGMCRLFNIAGFFLTLALAVAPIPLLVSLTGYRPW